MSDIPQRDLKRDETERLDARASAWLDESMTAQERADWDEAMREDAELGREFKAFEQVVTGLRRLPPVDAPDDFLKAVQSRIRRRSRGRFYGWDARIRFPYEAVINGVLLGLLLVVYMLGMPSAWDTPQPVSVESIQNSTKAAGLAPHILTFYGDVRMVSQDEERGAVTYRVVVPGAELKALQTELSLFPQMQVLGQAEELPDGKVVLTVEVK